MGKIPTAKEFYLKTVFPTSYENKRDEVELWFETNPDAQQNVSIMTEFVKLYEKQIADKTTEVGQDLLKALQNMMAVFETMSNNLPTPYNEYNCYKKAQKAINNALK